MQGFGKLRETICQYLAYIQGSKYEYVSGNKLNIYQCENYQDIAEDMSSSSETRPFVKRQK